MYISAFFSFFPYFLTKTLVKCDFVWAGRTNGAGGAVAPPVFERFIVSYHTSSLGLK